MRILSDLYVLIELGFVSHQLKKKERKRGGKVTITTIIHHVDYLRILIDLYVLIEVGFASHQLEKRGKKAEVGGGCYRKKKYLQWLLSLTVFFKPRHSWSMGIIIYTLQISHISNFIQNIHFAVNKTGLLPPAEQDYFPDNGWPLHATRGPDGVSRCRIFFRELNSARWV